SPGTLHDMMSRVAALPPCRTSRAAARELMLRSDSTFSLWGTSMPETQRLRIVRSPALAVAAALVLCLGAVSPVGAQQIDILLKGGHVIDPRNGIDSAMDVAIAGDRIVQVAPNIPTANALQVVDVAGMYVTPGLIDMHVHVFYREAARAIKPDIFAP